MWIVVVVVVPSSSSSKTLTQKYTVYLVSVRLGKHGGCGCQYRGCVLFVVGNSCKSGKNCITFHTHTPVSLFLRKNCYTYLFELCVCVCVCVCLSEASLHFLYKTTFLHTAVSNTHLSTLKRFSPTQKDPNRIFYQITHWSQ